MRLAVFDIDGTLVTGPSTEKRFFLHLVRSGKIGPRQVLAFVWFLLRWSPRFGRHVFKKNKAYLAWLRVEDIERLATDWAASKLTAAWFAPCVERLRRHREGGDAIVLVSGTPDFIAAGIARALGVEHAIGTHCAVINGRFGREPPVSHPFTSRKVEIIGEQARQAAVSLADTVAYGDSIYDLPAFLAVGTAVAVRPDEQLAAVAEQAGWEVIGRVRQSWLSRLWPASVSRGNLRWADAATPRGGDARRDSRRHR
jgi:HAD superfamily hydrolase (TIGR01490 family)